MRFEKVSFFNLHLFKTSHLIIKYLFEIKKYTL